MPSAPTSTSGVVASTRTHEKDPRAYRATFGTAYPREERHFTSKQELAALATIDGSKAGVSSVKVFWEVSGASVKRVAFRECSFHTTRGASATLVHELTFEECDFTQSFLGFVQFRRTTFRNCSFARCEMSRAAFDDCTFENCTFRECTPWEATFQRTLVPPEAFLDGFQVPPEHLSALSPPAKTEIEGRRLRSMSELAEQLLRSNEERRHALYCDRALFRARKATAQLRLSELRDRSGLAWAWGGLALALSYAYLILTRGGTSLSRLLAVAVCTCLLLTVLFLVGVVQVTVQGAAATSLSFPMCLSAAVSLFFAYGYTNFGTSNTLGTIVMTFFPLFGLTWSALVFAVVVRRAYR